MFYRDFLNHVPLMGVAHRFPKELRHLVESPVPPTTWLPEVHTNALYLAACDLVLRDDREANCGHVRGEPSHTLQPTEPNHVHGVYAEGVALRRAWAMGRDFIEGATSRPRGVVGAAAPSSLATRKYLFPELMIRVYEGIFQVVFNLVTNNAKVHLLACSPTSANYEVQWG